MKRLLATLLAAALALPAARAQDMIGISWSGTVFSMDSATGSGSPLGASGFSSINSMARSPGGTVYALAGYGSPNALITIDPATGAGTQVAMTSLISARGMAFDGAGTLYVVNDSSGTGIGVDDLYTVDTATGAATFVGSTGYLGVQGLAYLNGTLYGWELGSGSGVGAGLITISTASGVGTDVNAAVGNNGDIQTLCAAPGGGLYGARSGIFTIDTGTGSATLVGTGNYSDLRGAEFTGGGGFALARTGSCPGATTLTTAGGTPGGSQVFLHGTAGAFTWGGNPCTGLTLPLGSPTVAGILTANGSGSASVSFNAPASFCGRLVVVVDVGSCAVSNTITL